MGCSIFWSVPIMSVRSEVYVKFIFSGCTALKLWQPSSYTRWFSLADLRWDRSHKVLWFLRCNEVMHYGKGQKEGKSTFSNSQVLTFHSFCIYILLKLCKDYLHFSIYKFMELSNLPLFMIMDSSVLYRALQSSDLWLLLVHMGVM